MKQFIKLSLVLCCLMLVGSYPATKAYAEIPAQIRSQLPKPPAGFDWNMHKNALFLKPNGWNELAKREPNPKVFITTYAASPEKFSKTKNFEMGMSLQILSGAQKNSQIKAANLALMVLEPLLKSRPRSDVLIFNQKKAGPFDTTVFRYRDAPKGVIPIVVHKYILANNGADSVHIFTYESPEKSWKENWVKFGSPILGKVNVVTQLPPD